MKSQNKLLYVFIGLIVILAIILTLLPKGGNDNPETPAKTPSAPAGKTTPPAAAEQDAPNTETAPDTKQTQAQSSSLDQAANELSGSFAKIARLQALQDNSDEKPEEAMTLAKELSKSTKEEECSIALQTFRWIGGKDAVQGILPMLKHNNEEVAEEAQDTLRQLIQQNLFEDATLLSTDDWMTVLKQLETDEAREEYLTLLVSFDAKEAVPVLLKLYDQEMPNAAKLASEYMEFVAGGTSFTSRGEAENWFQTYLKEQAEAEAEAE